MWCPMRVSAFFGRHLRPIEEARRLLLQVWNKCLGGQGRRSRPLFRGAEEGHLGVDDQLVRREWCDEMEGSFRAGGDHAA